MMFSIQSFILRSPIGFSEGTEAGNGSSERETSRIKYSFGNNRRRPRPSEITLGRARELLSLFSFCKISLLGTSSANRSENRTPPLPRMHRRRGPRGAIHPLRAHPTNSPGIPVVPSHALERRKKDEREKGGKAGRREDRATRILFARDKRETEFRRAETRRRRLSKVSRNQRNYRELCPAGPRRVYPSPGKGRVDFRSRWRAIARGRRRNLR